MTTQCALCTICDRNLQECLYCGKRHCARPPCGIAIDTGRYLVYFCAVCHQQILIDSHLQLSASPPTQVVLTTAVADAFADFLQWPTAEMIVRQSAICYICANKLRPRMTCVRCKCHACEETCSVVLRLFENDTHPYVVCQRCWHDRAAWSEEFRLAVTDRPILEAPY